MRYTIHFQLLESGDSRPQEDFFEEFIDVSDGKTTPIPNVGDAVEIEHIEHHDTKGVFKVLTRLFSYYGENLASCQVNIVVTELPPEEVDKLKVS